MSAKVVFRCEHCDGVPDRVTQRTLEHQLRDRTIGRYRDAQPGGWLIWTAGGPFGPRRYACAEHRDELIGYLCRRYGSRAGIRDSEPFPSLWPEGFSGLDEREFAALLGGVRREPAGPPPQLVRRRGSA